MISTPLKIENPVERPMDHGAPNETQLSLELDLLVPLDLVKGGRVKKSHSLKMTQNY